MKVHKTLLLRLILLVCVVAPSGAWAAFFSPDIRPGYGVTSCGWLSDYFPPLRGTHMDTPVFFLDSGTPGATFLVLGGTHAREIAGYTAATVLVENVRAAQGRLIVIPHANSSAMSVRDEQKGIKRFHEITSRSGKRFLPYGNRYTDPADQGVKDPETYIHPSGYQLKKGAESRNLNRAYPGKAHGDTHPATGPRRHRADQPGTGRLLSRSARGRNPRSPSGHQGQNRLRRPVGVHARVPSHGGGDRSHGDPRGRRRDRPNPETGKIQPRVPRAQPSRNRQRHEMHILSLRNPEPGPGPRGERRRM